MANLITSLVGSTVGKVVEGVTGSSEAGSIIGGTIAATTGLLADPTTEEKEFAGDRIDEDSKNNTVITSQEGTQETSMIQESGTKWTTNETTTSDTVGTMKGMTERWIKLIDMTWTTNDELYSIFNEHINYPNDILNKNAAFQSFFTFFNYFTCNLQIKVILTATKFQQGAVYVTYTPNVGSNSTTDFDLTKKYTNIRMLPHTIINIQNATSGTFKIPYNNGYPLFNRNTQRPRGFIFGGVWSKLVVGDGAPTDIPIAVYASVEDLKVKAMGKEKTPFATAQYLAIRRVMMQSLERMQHDEKSFGLISQILSKVREEYPLAFAEVDTFNIASHVFNTANISQTETFLNDLSFVGDIRTQDDTVVSTKPITFPELMAIPMPIQEVEWKTTQGPGTVLFQTPIAPLCFTNWEYSERNILVLGEVGVLTNRETMIDYVAKYANFWRGNIKFDFEFFNPGLMKGRVKIGVLFGEHPFEETENNYFITHDLGLEDKAQLIVPFNSWRDWMQVPSITQKAMNYNPGGDTHAVQADKMIDGFSIGTLGMTVINSLSSNNTMANHIYVKVNVSSDDIQFAFPARGSQHYEWTTTNSGWSNYYVIPDHTDADDGSFYPDWPPRVYGETPGDYKRTENDLVDVFEEMDVRVEADFTGSFAAQGAVDASAGELETNGTFMESYLPNHITLKNLLKRPVLIAQCNAHVLGNGDLKTEVDRIVHNGPTVENAMLFEESANQGVTEIGFNSDFEYILKGDQWKSWPWCSGIKPWFEHEDVCKLGSYYSGSARIHIAVTNVRSFEWEVPLGDTALVVKKYNSVNSGPLLYITFNDGVTITEKDLMFNGAYAMNLGQQKMGSFRIPYYQIEQQRRTVDSDQRVRLFLQNNSHPISFNIRVWMTWEEDFNLYFPRAIEQKEYVFGIKDLSSFTATRMVFPLRPRERLNRTYLPPTPIWVQEPPGPKDLTIDGDVESNPGPNWWDCQIRSLRYRKNERGLVHAALGDFPWKMQQGMYRQRTTGKEFGYNEWKNNFNKVDCKIFYERTDTASRVDGKTVMIGDGEKELHWRAVLVARNEQNQMVYADMQSGKGHFFSRDHKKIVRAEFFKKYEAFIGRTYEWFEEVVEEELEQQKAFRDRMVNGEAVPDVLEEVEGFQVEGLFDSIKQTQRFVINITNAVALINKAMGFKETTDAFFENAKKKYFMLFVKLLLAIANIAMNPTKSCFALTVSSLLIDIADLIPGLSERVSKLVSDVVTRVFEMLKGIGQKTEKEKRKMYMVAEWNKDTSEEVAFYDDPERQLNANKKYEAAVGYSQTVKREDYVMAGDDEEAHAEVQESEPVERGIITIIVEAFYKLFNIKEGSTSTHVRNILGLFKGVAVVGSGIRGASMIVDLIVKAGHKVLSYFSDGFTEEERTSAWFRRNKKDCIDWHRCYTEFTATYDAAMIINDEVMKNRLSNLMIFGKEIYDNCLHSDVRSTTFSMFRTAWTELKTMHRNMLKAVHGSKSRPEPVVVYLYGDNGVGKSVLAMKMAKEMTHFFGGKKCYSMPPNPKYFDGYAAQSVVVMDDLGQHRDELDYSLFCQMISTAPFICPMASLEEKGASFTSPLVIATSNLDKPKPLTINDSGAIHRRFTFKVKVDMKNAYVCRSGQTKGKFDMAMALEDKSIRTGKCWHLDLMDGDFGNASQVDYMKLMAMIKKEVIRRRVTFDGVCENSIVCDGDNYLEMLAKARGEETPIWDEGESEAEGLWQSRPVDEEDTDYAVSKCAHGCSQFVTITTKDIAETPDQPEVQHLNEKDVTFWRKTGDMDPDKDWQVPHKFIRCERCEDNKAQCRACWFLMRKRDGYELKDVDIDEVLERGKQYYLTRMAANPFTISYIRGGKKVDNGYYLEFHKSNYHDFRADAESLEIIDLANVFTYETREQKRQGVMKAIAAIITEMLLAYAIVEMVSWAWDAWFGAKGEVYENGSGKKAKKSAVKAKVKVGAKARGENAEDKHEKISKNQFFVTVCSDKAEYGKGMITFIDQRTIMTCNHLFICDDDDEITHFKYKRGEATCSIPISMKKVARIELGDMQSDVAIVALDSPVPNVKDIAKHFANNEQMGYFATHAVQLISKKGNVRRVVEAPTARMYKQQSYVHGNDKYEHAAIIKYATSDRGPGDSGALLTSMNPHFSGTIIGMHVAGTTNCGWAVPLTCDIVSDMVMAAHNLRSEHNFKPVEAPREFDEEEVEADSAMGFCGGKVRDLGPAPRPCNVARKSNFNKSPIHGKVFPVLRQPAPMVKGDRRVLEEHKRDPLENMPKKYSGDSGYVDQELLNKVVDFCGNIAYEGGRSQKHNILTDDEMVNGMGPGESLEQIPMSTSPGYPYSLDNGGMGKYPFFDVVEEKENGQKKYAPNEALRKRIDERVNLAKQRKRIDGSYFQTSIKSELRPINKVEVNGARTIEGCPLDYLLPFRKYIGAFANWMTRNYGNETGSSVGCDPDVDWTTFMTELEQFDYHFAVDFTNWDGNIPCQYLHAAALVINRFYDGAYEQFLKHLEKNPPISEEHEAWKRAYGDHSYKDKDGNCVGSHENEARRLEEEHNVRATLLDELAFTLSVVGPNIIQTICGLPSGHPITALLNGLIHWMKFCVAYLESTKEHPDLHSLDVLHDNSTKMFYGDDGTYGVTKVIAKVFSRMELARTSAKEGMKCTMEDKQAEMVPFSKLEELTYLKRHFVRCEKDSSIVLAPIEMRTIGSLLNWVRNDALFEDNVKDACWFLYHHGRAVYDDTVKRLRDALEEVGLAFPIPTWNQMFQNHMVKFNKLDGTWRTKPVVPAWVSAKSRLMIQNHLMMRKLRDSGKSIEDWNPYMLGAVDNHYCDLCDRVVFGKLDGKCLGCLGIDQIPAWYYYEDRTPERCIELERHHVLGHEAWDPRHGDGPGGASIKHHRCIRCSRIFLHLTQVRRTRVCLPCLGIECPAWFYWKEPKQHDRKKELLLGGDIETNPGPDFQIVGYSNMHHLYEDAMCNGSVNTCLTFEIPDLETMYLHCLFIVLLGVVIVFAFADIYRLMWRGIKTMLYLHNLTQPIITEPVRIFFLVLYIYDCIQILKVVLWFYSLFVGTWFYFVPVYLFIHLSG